MSADLLGRERPRRVGLTWITTGIVVLALLLSIGATVFAVLAFRNVAGQGHTSCVVQGRGLRAQPHLTTAMAEIEILLTPFPGEKQQPIPKPLVAPLKGLRYHLHAYTRLEAGQPKRRDC